MSNLLASAFSATLSSSVVAYSQHEREKGKGEGSFKALGIETLFNISHLVGPVGDVRPKLPSSVSTSSFPIYVKSLTGKVITIQTASHQYVVDIRKAILDVEGVPPEQQRLIFDGKQLEDSQRVYEVGIEPYATIYMVIRIYGGGYPTYYIDDSLLDPKFDYDFSSKEDYGTLFYRGGKRYYRPYGWKRYALGVLGRYDNDTWLGWAGYRTNSSPGEWAVSYHGTAVASSGSIAQEGYDLSKGKRFAYGRGVYTAPAIEVAAKYAQRFDHEGSKYQLVFQNRVSVDDLKVVDSPFGEYWVQPQQSLVRPYGICIRRVKIDATENK